MKHFKLGKLNLSSKLRNWYERPASIKIQFTVKKSTVIILILLGIILWQHYHSTKILNSDIIKSSAQAGSLSTADTPTTIIVHEASGLVMNLNDKGRLSVLKPLQSTQQPLTQIAVQVTTPAPISYPTGCTDPKSCIYMHESGNNPNATNSLGCYGLGQDCNGVVKGQCGADYACQDTFFTNYANVRYGGWTNAWAWWQIHSWW